MRIEVRQHPYPRTGGEVRAGDRADADDPLAEPVSRPRPLRLLPQPEPIDVLMAEVPDGPPAGMIWRRVRYRFLKASGPERIGAEWWDARTATAVLDRRDSSKAHATGPAAQGYFERRRKSRAITISPRTMAAGASGCSGEGCYG